MRVMTSVLVLCAIGFLGADDPKKEESKIKGKWSVVSLSQGGTASPAGDLKDFKCTFEEKKYNNVVNGEVVEEGEYTFDDAKSPKTIDFDIKKGHDEGKKQVGIFKIEDDKMTIVLGMPGSTERPTSFKVEAGSMILEVVLERVKS
jgi:uncharacterized protein (TIGR03067 family)